MFDFTGSMLSHLRDHIRFIRTWSQEYSTYMLIVIAWLLSYSYTQFTFLDLMAFQTQASSKMFEKNTSKINQPSSFPFQTCLPNFVKESTDWKRGCWLNLLGTKQIIDSARNLFSFIIDKQINRFRNVENIYLPFRNKRVFTSLRDTNLECLRHLGWHPITSSKFFFSFTFKTFFLWRF